MNIKTIIVTASSLLIAFPAFAIDYPTIAGITITESTSAADFIIYLFNLGIAVGAFIAVIMVFMAGFEWLTSSGNPSKVESAKGKIINTLFGVCVLFGCYLILNTINSQLASVTINNLDCNYGLVVSVKKASDGKIEQVCMDGDQNNISDTIISTVKWNFPVGYLLKAYVYSEPNYKGTITEIDCENKACDGDIAGAKSVYLLLNKPGIYLYDDNNYKSASPAVKSYPLVTSSSIPDLSSINSFDNFTKSLKIVNPDQTKEQIQYQAVVFKDPNYQGRCAFVATWVPDMDQAPDGNYTDNIGDNMISSIIVAKANLDQSKIFEKRGEIILYTKTNCGRSGASEEIKSCSIPIRSISEGQVNILKQCPNFKSFEVQSFEITGAAGLVLSTKESATGGTTGGADVGSLPDCMYFDKKTLSDGTCYSNLMNSPIYTVGGQTPQSFIVLPDN
ncbi:pilin [bacterium]|jgi:hypothetical protein|nr:pilin [bacterium]